MKLPSVKSLKARHAAACDLKQAIDRDKITVAMREWLIQIGAPAETKISFVASGKEIERDARAARAAQGAGLT